MRRIDTVVIGGGQAGLAMSRCLLDRRIDHVVLERGRVAERWRSERWDSLRLLTPNWQTRLPGFRYDGPDPDGYMGMPELIRFFERYAGSFRAPVETVTEVASVTREGAWLRVRTTRGDWRARHVVVATGYSDRPHVPRMASALPGWVHQVVPSAYRHPGQLPEGGVLVVGASATGIQLAEEIHESGRPVTLAVGRHLRLPRTYRGRDILWWLDRMGVFEEGVDVVADIRASRGQPSLQLVGRADRRSLDVASLQRRGVRLLGRLAAADGTRAWFDDEIVATTVASDLKLAELRRRIDRFIAASGLDDVAGSPEPFEPTWPVAFDAAPTEVDLEAAGIRTVLWATGFRRAYPWLRLPVLGPDGDIRHQGGPTPDPGLFVVGMHFQRRRNSAFIDGVGADAEHVAHLIESRSQTGVRPGSDRGQTGVRPGSDRGQTGVRPGSGPASRPTPVPRPLGGPSGRPPLTDPLDGFSRAEDDMDTHHAAEPRSLKTRYDAVVVGGRCAGGATALLLARAGLDVLLVEQGARGADTLSTLALMRGGVMQLARWGLLDAVRASGTPQVRTTTFHYGEEPLRVPIRARDGVDALYAPRRTFLDPLLADAAADAGATVAYRTRLLEVIRDPRERVCGVRVESAGERRVVAAGIVIGADGMHSAVARQVGADPYRTGRHTSTVIYGLSSGLEVDGYHWHYAPGVSAGVIPTGGGEVLVFASAPRERFMRELRQDLESGFRAVLAEAAPALASRLAGPQAPHGFRAFAGLHGYFRPAYGPGWALVGDAGYFKDPLTAHGITDALRDAELLARAVVRGTGAALADYQAVRDALSVRLFEITDAIASLDWEMPSLRALHKTFSEQMAQENDHMRALHQGDRFGVPAPRARTA